MGKHISDTHIMCWEISYGHPQCGLVLFVDILCQATTGCPATAAVCGGKDMRTNIDR